MYQSRQHRAAPALASAAVVAGIALVLMRGLAGVPSLGGPMSDVLAAVKLTPSPKPPPPPKPKPKPVEETRRAQSRPGGSAPAPAGTQAPRANPLPVALPPPPPVIVLPTPAASAPGSGQSVNAGGGTSGKGTGPGSGGSGSGGNGNGSGDGSGSGDGVAVEAQLIDGHLRVNDLLGSLFSDDQDVHVRVRLNVGPDGRASTCAIDLSSGQPKFDARVCELIEKRFRFRPARDRAGNPVNSTVVQNHEWLAKH